MNRRYLAIATLLATTLTAANGCATGSAQRQQSASGPVAARTVTTHAPPTQVQSTQSQGSLLNEVEAPRIASATKFEDAPSAGESPQVRSMREQMARRYGCCGK